MNPTTPIISSAIAALLGLLGCVLTVRVIVQRVRTNTQAGDGGHAALGQAIRAHANFAEHVPLAVVLIVLAELLGAWPSAIVLLGVALLIARAVSAWGLSRSLGASSPRQAGAGMTVLVVVVSCILILLRLAAMR